MSTVLTIGTFDLPHAGHFWLFEQCHRIAGAGRVVVGINPDEFVECFKGHRPVQTLAERQRIVSGCRFVSRVLVNEGMANAAPLIDEARPDFLVVGEDWARRDYLGQLGIDEGYLTARGICLLYMARVGGWSSTELKDRIKNA